MLVSVPLLIAFILLLGGESIHKEFHKLHDVHAGMARDPVGRLKAMMNKHHIRVSPKGRKHVPEKVKRNLKSKN